MMGEYLSCDSCAHEYMDSVDEPCRNCKENYLLKWEPKNKVNRDIQELYDWASSQEEDNYRAFKDKREQAVEEVVYFFNLAVTALRNEAAYRRDQ